MVIRSALTVLFLGACTPALPGPPPDAQTPGPPGAAVASGSASRGGLFAKAHCSSCHAVGATGISPLAAAPPLREVSRRYPVEQLAEAFAEGFMTLHPTMPEFVLDPRENEDLIAYLASIQED